MLAGGDRGEVTRLLVAWQHGNRHAQDVLIPLVYRELRRLAAHYLRGERRGHTLQPTALVHEAYLRLVDERDVGWRNRAHFFGLAAQSMRRVLVDHARRRLAEKRGGGAVHVSLSGEEHDGVVVHLDVPDEQASANLELLDLDAALRELAAMDPQLVQVVELRYFAGMTVEESAEVLAVSPATVKRAWTTARAWLFDRLSGAPA